METDSLSITHSAVPLHGVCVYQCYQVTYMCLCHLRYTQTKVHMNIHNLNEIKMAICVTKG